MPKLFNISAWSAQPWFSTGGTRSKKYVQDPGTGKYYYFKKSFKRGGQDYFFEFWSEIIATEIGLQLGFDVLKYDIAIDKNEMGCISESMLSKENEILVEGGQYLRAFENLFDPNIKKARKLHSFQLIEKTLALLNQDVPLSNILELIIFDAIIGNGDRHQENWAFINVPSYNKNLNISSEVIVFSVFEILANVFNKDGKFKLSEEDKEAARLLTHQIKSFAPIYDNGSSLGRELEDEKVIRMLKDEIEFTAYVNRGESEIHWENEKLKHIELIKRLLKTKYADTVSKIIKRVSESYQPEKLETIINLIDTEVTEEYEKYKLPVQRKRLMIKLVTLRIQLLRSLLHERV